MEHISSTRAEGEEQAGELVIHKADMLRYSLGDIAYFSPILATAAPCPAELAFQMSTPIMIIRPRPDEAGLITAHMISDAIRDALRFDDVLSRLWLKHLVVILQDPGSSPGMSGLEQLKDEYEIQEVTFIIDDKEARINTAGSPICDMYQGPYSVYPEGSSSRLLPVYRLYPDTFRSFLFVVYPSSGDPGRYRAFRKLDDRGYNLIPVPSRLYHTQEGGNGIRGKRIGVKDIYDVSGVPTSGGSRAYGEMYGDAESSAESIQRILALGGVLVGKTKTSNFAFGSKTHEGTLDELYPFSPRADLYQSVSSSSSGSASALASYDWLDVALGTDTTGSNRSPPATVGLYGNRPSIGIISTEGVIPLSKFHDTLGIATRDPRCFTQFMRSWYELRPTRPAESLPKTILVANDYLPTGTPELDRIVREFLSDIQTRLGVELKHFNLDGSISCHGYPRERMAELDRISGEEVLPFAGYRDFGERFCKDYATFNNGRFPPVDTRPRKIWRMGRELGEGFLQQYESGVHQLQAFREIFNEEILTDKVTGSSKIMIFAAHSSVHPTYRLQSLNDQIPQDDKDGELFASLAGFPEYSIPIGQVGFESLISGEQEMMPVSLSFAAKRDYDNLLADFLDRLVQVGLLKTVKTGRTAF